MRASFQLQNYFSLLSPSLVMNFHMNKSFSHNSVLLLLGVNSVWILLSVNFVLLPLSVDSVLLLSVHFVLLILGLYSVLLPLDFYRYKICLITTKWMIKIHMKEILISINENLLFIFYLCSIFSDHRMMMMMMMWELQIREITEIRWKKNTIKNERITYNILIGNVGWFVGFYGISTLVGYLMPNPFLCK